MSYARWGEESDVYIFEHVAGYIQCCGCQMTKTSDKELFGFANLKTARKALEHLDAHVANGDKVSPSTFEKIKKEHPDLDAEIPPYVVSPEKEAEQRELFRKFWENE